MEEERTHALPDANPNLEMLIRHWETRLSDSLEAVRVAQEQLGKLYPQRYPRFIADLGHTGLQLMINEGRE